MIAKWSDRILHILFFTVFSIITVGVIGSVCGVNFWGIIAAAGIFGAGVAAVYLLYKRLGSIESRKADIIFAVIAAMTLIFQLTAANLLLANPVTDWRVIHEVALAYARDGSMENMYENLPHNIHYLAKYTNNNAAAAFMAIFYRAVYIIFGDVPLIAPVLLNTAFIFISVVFCYLIAKRILGNFGGLVAAAICLFFLPYYTYTPYFYTDSLSMPFTVLSLYLFIRAYESDRPAVEIGLYSACALSIAVGYLLKGNIIVVLVGVILFVLVKGGAKKATVGAGVTVTVFILGIAMLNLMISSLHMTTEEEKYTYQYPLTHWVMMGLKGEGGYDQADSSFTNSAGNYDQKQAANLEEIEKRISEYGFGGMCKHLYDKAVFTWEDGTYWVSNHIFDNAGERSFLHELVLKNGKTYSVFYCISAGMQIVILLMFCITSLYYIVKPRCDYMTLVRLLIFGIAMFLLVWETRSRYLFNFTPLFLIVTAQGMLICSRAVDRLKPRGAMSST